MGDQSVSALDSASFSLRNGSLGLTLRFNPDALSALKAEIGAGFLSIPRRGAEVGGILIGEVRQDGPEWTVVVEEIVPVPVSYEFGPSYRLSAPDKQRFQELASTGRAASRRIGWFRSNTRPEHRYDESDRQVSEAFFGSKSVFLFCEPSADGSIRAACVMMLPSRNEVAFPFELGRFSRLNRLGEPRPAHPSTATDTGKPVIESAVLTAVPPVIAAPQSLAPAPIVRGSGPLRARNFALFAGCAAVAGIGWYAHGRVPSVMGPALPGGSPASHSQTLPPAAPQSVPSLGLRAEYQGNALLLAWDRSSPYVNSAVSGAFTIDDGSKTRTLNLSPRELRTGSILYKPSADEISVELQIATPGGAASQSIRIIGAASPVVAVAAARAPAPRVVPETSIRETVAAVTPRMPAAQFQPPPAPAKAPQKSISTLDPPVLGEMQSAQMQNAQMQNGGGQSDLPVVIALPPRPASQPPVSAEPVIKPPVAGTPQSTANTARQFQPPTPIHAPQPQFPVNGLPNYALDRPSEVKVEVHIDANGRVTGARLAGETGPFAVGAASSALNAARAWTFRPATLGGQPVESTMVLTFRFSPPGAPKQSRKVP